MCLAAQACSAISLTGLVQHMAEVERNWVRRVLAAGQAPPVYDPHADPDGPDGCFDLAEGATLSGALAVWRAEIARVRERFWSGLSAIFTAHSGMFCVPVESVTGFCRFLHGMPVGPAHRQCTGGL